MASIAIAPDDVDDERDAETKVSDQEQRKLLRLGSMPAMVGGAEEKAVRGDRRRSASPRRKRRRSRSLS